MERGLLPQTLGPVFPVEVELASWWLSQIPQDQEPGALLLTFSRLNPEHPSGECNKTGHWPVSYHALG